MIEMSVIKKHNLNHSEKVKSEEFQRRMSKDERDEYLKQHVTKINNLKSLLGRLLVLSGKDLNADVNADIDDVLEIWDIGKRLTRRLRKAYYVALAKRYLKEFKDDPLKLFGNEADKELKKIRTIDWAEVKRFRVGNKYYAVNNNNEVVTKEAKL